MSPWDVPNDRTRAWILIEAEEPETAARDLYHALFEQGGNDYVVIRADVVEGANFNVIVAVDAATPRDRDYVVREVPKYRGTVIGVATVPANGHFPAIPHNAHGFITPEEWVYGDDKLADKYRLPKSPGFNAWG